MLIERIAAPLAGAWGRLKEAGGVGRGSAELTEEELRSELADLGLLGRAFGSEEYRRALEERLGVAHLASNLLTPACTEGGGKTCRRSARAVRWER